MKKNIAVFLFIILAAFLIFSAYSKKATAPTPIPQSSPSPAIPTNKPTTAQSSSCTPADLQAMIMIDHAAGNVYGTMTLKNISPRSCQFNASAFIKPVISAQNITVTQQGQPGPTALSLAPNQTLYSQVHFPNGPQCQSGILQENISFTYPLSENNIITFKDQNGQANQNIVVCKSPSEKTDVQVWSLTEKPVNS